MDYQLEIHHVDVSGGDATVIVVRRLEQPKNPIVKVILVDTGGVGSGPRKLIKYFQDYFPGQAIDLLIVSHYHDDHINGIKLHVEKARFFNPKQLLDIGHDKDTCFPVRTIHDENITSPKPRYIKNYTSFSRDYKGNKRIIPDFMKASSYDDEGKLKDKTIKSLSIQARTTNEDTGFFITYWSGKGLLADGTNVISNQKTKHRSLKINANDLSISFTIHNPVTGFSYFSGGDLSGDPKIEEYFNMEGPTVRLISNTFKEWNKNVEGYEFGIDIVKASHHGSDRNNHNTDDDKKDEHNNAPGFLTALKPKVVIVPCNQIKSVPGPEFIKTRLCEYLQNDENRKAYFINQFYYPVRPQVSFKNVMPEAFETLLQNAESQTNITIEDNIYSVGTLASIIIVTGSKKALTLVGPKDGVLQQPQDGNYSIYLNTSLLLPTKAYKRSASALEGWLDTIRLEKYKKGFKAQAEEIVDELNKGPIIEKFEFLESDFPSLRQCFIEEQAKVTEETIRNALNKKDIVSSLYNAMDNVFKTCYYRHDNTSWFLNKEPDSKVETTLVNLLYCNIHQKQFQKYNNCRQIVSGWYENLIHDRWEIKVDPVEIKKDREESHDSEPLKRTLEEIYEYYEDEIEYGVNKEQKVITQL